MGTLKVSPINWVCKVSRAHSVEVEKERASLIRRNRYLRPFQSGSCSCDWFSPYVAIVCWLSVSETVTESDQQSLQYVWN